MSNTREWERPETEHTDVVPVDVVDDSTGPLAANVRLVCVAGEDLGKTFQISKAQATIGRADDADVKLSSGDVSRRHATLAIERGALVLRDLDSLNGTFVNGLRINGDTSLEIGDRFQIGNTILLLTLHDELEARMQQIQRVEAMAAVAGGLAHDFRNALMVICAGLDELDEVLPDDANDLRQTAQSMRAATTTATALASRLLNLGRRGAASHDRVSVREIVEEIVGMSRRALGRQIEVKIDIAPRLTIRGSREELHQVLMNFLVNAKDAMPNGGAITFAAELLHLETARALSYHLPAKGAYVELRIADTGMGMDEATLARAFEPFFTTKPVGVGTGLGLAVVHAIVKRHGGSILAESAPGRGTTFRVYLPASA